MWVQLNVRQQRDILVLMTFVLKGKAHAGLPSLNGGAIAGFFLTLLPLYGLAPLAF